MLDRNYGEFLPIKALINSNFLNFHVCCLTKIERTIKIDHAIIHRTEIQVKTTDKETTLNHHIGIKHVIKDHTKIIEVIHLNIKGKVIKYKQLKKLNQTPWY